MAALQIVGSLAPGAAPALSLLRPRRLSTSSSILLPRQWAPSPTRMGLKVVHTYDASFELKPECEEMLHTLLDSPTFRRQVSGQAPETNTSFEYEFTGELFQPVPWSVTTRHGMPQEFEKYFNHPEYAIVNVPPNFMFKAKIFRPSRLCAVFKKVNFYKKLTFCCTVQRVNYTSHFETNPLQSSWSTGHKLEGSLHVSGYGPPASGAWATSMLVTVRTHLVLSWMRPLMCFTSIPASKLMNGGLEGALIIVGPFLLKTFAVHGQLAMNTNN
ncbi:hypothetical protein GOP47_0006216 [Adiantum capillus-veneris]|uniref:Uncharacterized protein n=1 Tax=Adiantum capillus-veneris TaxID=13818 RepID=A0A9D4V311_ADICA|nr:hypothetical protein GOP47_0006216 [Adiantum capillus-veneris]